MSIAVDRDSDGLVGAMLTSMFRYWNGNGWQTERIVAAREYALLDTNGNPLPGPTYLNGVSQGSGMYNTYLQKFLYCYRFDTLRKSCRAMTDLCRQTWW